MTRRETSLAFLEDGRNGMSGPPAFVIDVDAGAVVAANAAARRAWGMAGSNRSGPMAVDRAMPALSRLASLGGARAHAELTFWTQRGLLRLDCRIEPAGAGRYLVRGLSSPGGEDAAAGRRPLAPRSAAPAAPAAHPARDLEDARMSALARLAHEVRTPLSAAIAYAEILKEEHFGPLADARYREYARHIYDSARHALSVVDGMLARDPQRSGMPELAFRDLDPVGVIDNCVAVARPLAERAGLDLVACASPDTPRVVADEVSLKQMLLNLITNAIKFARPGDRVTLATAYGGDGCLRIEVADNGPGMTGAALALRAGAAAQAADGTATAAGGSPGLGIGLPLTRALAEANGARLIVDSVPGSGTRVTIAFAKDRVVL